jgi:ADP-ribosyl-[dinitrogen reductase] hydrolase
VGGCAGLERKDNMNQTQDSYRGALIGAAVGDSLGATVDTMTRDAVKRQFGVHRELIGGGPLKLKAGEVAGDTKLVLAVAESIVETGETDLKNIARKMAEWYSKNTAGQGCGPTTRSVLSVLKPRARDLFSPARKVWEQQGRDVAGSGCVARVAPIGMSRRVLFKELVVDTINVCRLTHYDQRCVDACIAFNFGVSYLTSGKDPSKLLFKTWRFLLDARSSKEYRELVGETCPKEDMVKALKAINDIQYDDLNPNGEALTTTQAAFWFALNAIDFEEGLVRTVNLGGDSGTLGAVAGSLLGARFGEQAIPERWLHSVKIRAEMEKLADKLCRLGEPKK